MEEKLQELQEKLDENIDYHGITTYNIIEKTNNGKTSYQVNMLQVVIENGVVLFEDEDMMLLNSNHLLRSFLLLSIDDIKITKDSIKIQFKNGSYVKIKPIR
jgi:archaellum component FlaF (FlaF/FlaG flagellin family)